MKKAIGLTAVAVLFGANAAFAPAAKSSIGLDSSLPGVYAGAQKAKTKVFEFSGVGKTISARGLLQKLGANRVTVLSAGRLEHGVMKILYAGPEIKALYTQTRYSWEEAKELMDVIASNVAHRHVLLYSVIQTEAERGYYGAIFYLSNDW